jgi:hypothetical protein
MGCRQWEPWIAQAADSVDPADQDVTWLQDWAGCAHPTGGRAGEDQVTGQQRVIRSGAATVARVPAKIQENVDDFWTQRRIGIASTMSS